MKPHRPLGWFICAALLTLGACAAHSSTSNQSAAPPGAEASAPAGQETAGSTPGHTGADADDWCLAQHFGSNFAEAKISCTSACDAGAKLSCDILARMYAGGEGVPKDSVRAQALYAKACKLGVSKACEASGADAATVVHAKEGECNGSSSSMVRDACRIAGEAYLDGRAVSIDRARARPLLEKACKLGDASACNAFTFSPKK